MRSILEQVLRANSAPNSNSARSADIASSVSRFGLLLFLLLLWAGAASATTVLPMNLAQLSEVAEKAFVARVDSVETTTAASRSYDLVTVTVTEPVFGDAATSDVVQWKQFRFSKNVALSGMPTYEPGREYLVFLSGKGRGTDFQMPVGLGQGAFFVKRNNRGEAVAVNGMANMSLSRNLDVSAASAAIVRNQPGAARLSARDLSSREATLKANLQPRKTGNSLDTIKAAAKFFHEQKTRGKSPALQFQKSSN